MTWSPVAIPTTTLPSWIGKMVHVLGWHHGAVFFYEGTINGYHQLRTPKTGKLYTVRNTLTYTKKR